MSQDVLKQNKDDKPRIEDTETEVQSVQSTTNTLHLPVHPKTSTPKRSPRAPHAAQTVTRT